MKMLKALSVAALLSLVFSCSNNASEEAANEMDSVATEEVAEPAAEVAEPQASTPERQFIRTADLRCKVNDVTRTTERIENFTSAFGGFVVNTDLNSTVDKNISVAVSADSSLESTYYTVSNNMTIRVPNVYLDTITHLIARDVTFFESRNINANDVSLQILANKMKQSREENAAKRLGSAAHERKGKIEEATGAEDMVSDRVEQRDKAVLDNLSLKDQVKYSTLTLYLYQDQLVKKQLVAIDKPLAPYEPGFGQKIWEALRSGWGVLEAILVFFTRLWGLLILALVIVFVVRKLVLRPIRNS